MWFLIWLACSTGPTDSRPSAADLPPIEHAQRTTRPELAVDGLNGRVKGLNEALPHLPDARTALLDAHALRVALLGKVSDLDAMFTAAGEGALGARPLLAVHRFDDALTLDPGVADSVALARHQGLDALEAKRREAVAKRSSPATWQALADVLAAQGKAKEADEAYWQALKNYKDVSPLYVADIQFRRGLLWGESGADPGRARALYTDAVTRLPQFVRAHVHLAELEWQAGEKAAAISRVREVADAEDPEPGGKLALWLEGDEAAAWRLRTVRKYDALLAKHPLAFADHAAEFFLAAGELERARELAKMNVDNRRTPRAIELCERTSCE